MEMQIGTSYCVQLSVDAARWGATALDGILSQDGKPVAGKDALETLKALKQAGYEVVPCEHAADGPPGTCPGVVVT